MYSVKQSLAQTLYNMYKFLEMHNRIKNKLRNKMAFEASCCVCTVDVSVALCLGIRILECGKLCLWNPERGKFSLRNPESRALIQHLISGIQDCLGFPYMGRFWLIFHWLYFLKCISKLKTQAVYGPQLWEIAGISRCVGPQGAGKSTYLLATSTCILYYGTVIGVSRFTFFVKKCLRNFRAVIRHLTFSKI